MYILTDFSDRDTKRYGVVSKSGNPILIWDAEDEKW